MKMKGRNKEELDKVGLIWIRRRLVNWNLIIKKPKKIAQIPKKTKNSKISSSKATTSVKVQNDKPRKMKKC